MNLHYRLKHRISRIAAIVVICALFGCKAHQAFNRGVQDQLTQDYEAAMLEYKKALDSDPSNVNYRLRYEQSKFAALLDHAEKGRRAFDQGDLQMAKSEYSRVLELDPGYAIATEELKKIDAAIDARSHNQQAPARTIEELKGEALTDANVADALQPKFTGPISFHMTQDSRTQFEQLAGLAGLNVIFDQTFRGARVALDLNNVSIYEALDILGLQTATFWEPVNKNTIVVSPDNQTKRRDYEPQIVKTIYLQNAVTATELTETITTLRTMLNMRYVAQSTAMNAIVVRGKPDDVAIAEQIVNMIDKSKPEVVIDVMVLEVDVGKALQLGVQPPQGTSLSYAPPGTTAVTSSASSGTSSTVNTAGNATPLNALGKAFSSSNFSLTIPTSVAAFLASNSLATLLQHPSVRATDGKQASLRIGEKIPVASGSFQPAFVGSTGTPVVQFQYYDVGVNVDVTPHVLLNRQVHLTVNIAVQAIAGQNNISGVEEPVISNRSVQHDIQLNEGETNVLGGIITDSESKSMSGLPGIMNIPVLRYLFGQTNNSTNKSEVIIMLTPHIVRMPDINLADLRGLSIGTETVTKMRQPAPILGAAPASGPTGAASPAPAVPAAPASTAPAVAAPAAPPAAVTPPAITPAPAPPAPTRQTTAALTFDPPVIVADPGPGKSVNINLNGSDISGVDLTFSFDPHALSIQSIRDGGLLSRDGQILAVVQRIDTEAGVAKVSIERPPGAPPISGNGALATLMIAAGERKGDAILRITDFVVRDAQQNVAVGKPVEARVTVH